MREDESKKECMKRKDRERKRHKRAEKNFKLQNLIIMKMLLFIMMKKENKSRIYQLMKVFKILNKGNKTKIYKVMKILK